MYLGVGVFRNRRKGLSHQNALVDIMQKKVTVSNGESVSLGKL